MLKKIGRSKYKIEEIDVENDPIDFVFTYVDFNDQGYQKKLINQAKKKDSSLLKSKENFLNRYIDYGEIYLSIYSVKKNLKFIRNIYIVTPTPNKIKEIYIDDKQIKIINDKDLLINQQVSRPCFKSTVIESFLYLIPNLSNVFLYGCDDMMVANEIKKESLFSDNIPNIFLDERRNLPHKVKNNTSPAFADIINTNNIFNKKFNKYYSLTHNHQITLMRRDLCQITHDIFKEEILKNSANMFRTPIKDNLHFFLLASFLGIHLNLLVKGNVKASGFYEMAYNKPWQRFYNYKNKGIKYFCVNNLSDVYYSYYLYAIYIKNFNSDNNCLIKNILITSKENLPQGYRDEITRYFIRNMQNNYRENTKIFFMKRNIIKNLIKNNQDQINKFQKFFIINLVNSREKINHEVKHFDNNFFYITVLKKYLKFYLPDIYFFLNHELLDNKINYLKKDKFIYNEKYEQIRINFSKNQLETLHSEIKFIKKNNNASIKI